MPTQTQFEVRDLGYAYDALEPYIDEQTMRIHHDKHYAGYTEKLNAALEGHTRLHGEPIEEILRNLDQLPAEIRTAVRNNGGGYANHSLFWEIMSPDGGGEPSGALAEAIRSAFGGFPTFKERLSSAAAGQFGSGWGWLVVNGGELEVISTANQDSPYIEGKTPILGVDVWEHAYYLKYQNRRPDYLSAWWHTVNWDAVSNRFEPAIK